MKSIRVLVIAAVLVAGSLSICGAEQAPPLPPQERSEVLTRGPINEAFAHPVNLEDQAGLIAPFQPPAKIIEVPPAERPDGDNFAWVPGYWAWDSDRYEFIWVSGCWRAVPPGMSWVPGYWSQAVRGWQWVQGFWNPVGNQEIVYLPPPPELTDLEPRGPAVSQDRIWVPPCWYWSQGQYRMRAGYWIVPQPDWVWVPSHYVWTPSGHIFVSGYWDYELSRRGVLFAPVYFPKSMYIGPGFSYPLSIAVEIDNLEFGLFTRPAYSHYYFGDYYDNTYVSIGIFPRYEVERRSTWYDPIYQHDRWRHRRVEPRWVENERHEYDRRRADRSLRPPATYREMEIRVSKMPASKPRGFAMAAPVRNVNQKTKSANFVQSRPEARQEVSRHTKEVHKFTEERRRWESQAPRREPDRPDVARNPKTLPREAAPAIKHKEPQMRPLKHQQSNDIRRNQAPADGRVWSPQGPEQRQPKGPSHKMERNAPYPVKIRTPPVVDGEQRPGPPRNKPPFNVNSEERNPSRH